ncbi:MAG: helix-turn-helix transcriptional regulator [Lachnospiraceae bacterium]|jgi:transcriptional regulator with XRE-family HTH domain|nr:helix-turn-helix transcriptional regulator [Lachnospiraceae bacterium]
MDIGVKIKDARLASNLTQEQVAEALGISRQTVSNWENGKTYPDIINVIKMSDLYHVSLDHLLKGEKQEKGTDYLDYLEESTNTVKSKHKLSVLILFMVYLGIWAASLIAFWVRTDSFDAMGYGIMFLWVLLPATTFIVSLLIGKGNYWGNWKWLSSLGFGIFYMLAEYATFSAANMVTFGKVNLPEFGTALAGAAVSFSGLGIGAVINLIQSKRKKPRR